MKLTDFIARTGENPTFVAFNAHAWFAFSLVSVWHVSFGARLAIAGAATLAALAKEFWFDLTFETTPPQTALDSLRDFIGYMSGIALAILVNTL